MHILSGIRTGCITDPVRLFQECASPEFPPQARDTASRKDGETGSWPWLCFVGKSRSAHASNTTLSADNLMCVTAESSHGTTSETCALPAWATTTASRADLSAPEATTGNTSIHREIWDETRGTLSQLNCTRNKQHQSCNNTSSTGN